MSNNTAQSWNSAHHWTPSNNQKITHNVFTPSFAAHLLCLNSGLHVCFLSFLFVFTSWEETHCLQADEKWDDWPFLSVFSHVFSFGCDQEPSFPCRHFVFFLRAKIANNSTTDFVESCLNLVWIGFRSLKYVYFFLQSVFHSVLPLLLPRRENERRTCF